MKNRIATIQSIKPAVLSKTAYLDENNQVQKSGGGPVVEGAFCVDTFETRRELAEFLYAAKQRDNVGMCLGVPKNGYTDGLILTREMLETADIPAFLQQYDLPEETPVIGRINGHWELDDQPGRLVIDYDPRNGHRVLSRDELRQKLIEACPILESAPMLWLTSSGSCIYHGNDQKVGVKGQRLYIFINRSRAIPRLIMVLFKRIWLQGGGYIFINAAGGRESRCLYVDRKLNTPEHFDFIGGIICKDGLETRYEPFHFWNEFAPDLDVDHPDLMDLTQGEEAKYRELEAEAYRLAEGEANAIKQAREDSEVDNARRKAQLAGKPFEETAFRGQIRELGDGGTLPADFILYSRRHGEVTAEKVRENKDEFNGTLFRPPLEPDYNGGRDFCAKAYLDGPFPFINCLSHGISKRFYLVGGPENGRNDDGAADKIRERLNKKRESRPRVPEEKTFCFETLDENYIDGFAFPGDVDLTDDREQQEIKVAKDVLKEGISRHGNQLGRATSGVGKTHVGIELAFERAKYGVVGYYFPNHVICKEWLAKLKTAHPNSDIRVVHLMGPASGSKRGGGTKVVCSEFLKVGDTQRRGFDIKDIHCVNCEYAKRDKRTGRLTRWCTYAKQLDEIKEQERGLIIAPHAYIPYHLSPAFDDDKDRGIFPLPHAFVDENPLDVMFHNSEPISIHEFAALKEYLTSDYVKFVELLEKFIFTVAQDMHRKKKHVVRYYTVTSPVKYWEHRSTLWQALGVSKEEAFDMCRIAMNQINLIRKDFLYEMDVSLHAPAWLNAAFSQTAVAYIEIKDAKAEFVYMQREQVDPRCAITFLEATIDETEAEFIFDREFEVTDALVPWEGQRIHIQTGMGIVKTKQLSANKDREPIKRVFELASRYVDERDVYLGTYLHHEKDMKKLLGKIVDNNVLTGHFGGVRSSNKFEDCGNAILLGAGRVPPEARIDQAAMIFPGDIAAQERWMVHKGHEETYQQAHRLRLIRTPGKNLIIADREWPTYLLGKADLTIKLPSPKTKKGRAVTRILEWLETHAELYKEDCWKLGIGWQEDERKIRKAYDGDDRLILFAGNDWWTDLSRAVLEAMPDLEILGIKNNHGKASKALRRKQSQPLP